MNIHTSIRSAINSQAERLRDTDLRKAFIAIEHTRNDLRLDMTRFERDDDRQVADNALDTLVDALFDADEALKRVQF